jgi:hypothetical protein
VHGTAQTQHHPYQLASARIMQTSPHLQLGTPHCPTPQTGRSAASTCYLCCSSSKGILVVHLCSAEYHVHRTAHMHIMHNSLEHMHKLVGRIIPSGLLGRDKLTRPCNTQSPIMHLLAVSGKGAHSYSFAHHTIIPGQMPNAIGYFCCLYSSAACCTVALSELAECLVQNLQRSLLPKAASLLS